MNRSIMNLALKEYLI